MSNITEVSREFGITGSSFCGTAAVNLIDRLRLGQEVALKREPDNAHDKNAIAVYVAGTGRGQVFKVGYIPRGCAAEMAPIMDAGIAIKAVRTKMNLWGVCRLSYEPALDRHADDGGPVPDGGPFDDNEPDDPARLGQN